MVARPAGGGASRLCMASSCCVSGSSNNFKGRSGEVFLHVNTKFNMGQSRGVAVESERRGPN